MGSRMRASTGTPHHQRQMEKARAHGAAPETVGEKQEEGTLGTPCLEFAYLWGTGRAWDLGLPPLSN